MNYQDWNDLLLKHFFAPERGDEEVFITVNRDFLDKLGSTSSGIDNGSEDFVRAVAFWAGTKRNICERAEDLRSSFEDGYTDHPTFFGVLCFFVLAWGEDADLNSANYYDRLNNLLAEDGATRATIGTQQFSSTKALWVSLGRWSSRERGTTRWGGRFVPRNFGKEYIGYPLAQAMLTANERERLERLFCEIQCEYDADDILPNEMARLLGIRGEQRLSNRAWKIFLNKDMRDAFVGMCCSLYRDWCIRGVDDDAGMAVDSARVGLRLVLRYDRLGNVSMAARLLFPNGDFPDGGCEVSLRMATGQAPHERRLLARQSACWSALIQPIDIGLVGQGTKVVVHFNKGQERSLPIAGLRQGAFYFEHDAVRGEWFQLTNGNTGVPCRLLLKGDAEGAAIRVRNHQVLKNRTQLPGGWELWDSPNGLVEVSGLGNQAEPPSIRLQGGLKIAARGDRYSEHGAPCICVHGGNLGEYKLQVIATSRASHMVYHEPQLRSGHMYPIPTEGLEPDQSYEVQLIRAANEEPVTRKRFSLETGGALQTLEHLPGSHWPNGPASPAQFLFSIDSFSLWLDTDRRIGSELLVTRDDLPAKCHSNTWVEGLKVMVAPVDVAGSCELVRHADSFWEIPDSLRPGRYHVRASWLGMEIGNQVPFRVGEVPRCQLRIENAERVSSGRAEAAVVFAVATDSTPRLIVDCSEKILARFHRNGGVFFSDEAKSIICNLKPDWLKQTCTIKVSCFFGTTELAEFETRFQHYPTVIVQPKDGEFWPNTRIYRSNRRPSLHVVAEGLDLNELTLFVGSQECSFVGGFFHVPVVLGGETHPIRVKWNNLLLAHEGCQQISIEAAPEYFIELQGGRQRSGGGYYQNALPRIKLGGRGKLPPPSNLSVVLDETKACELKVDGRIEVGKLESGRHRMRLHWRGIPVGDEMCLDVELPFKTSLVPSGGQMIAPNTYLTNDLPRIRLQNSVDQAVVVYNGRELEHLGDNHYSLNGIVPEGGQIKVDCREGDVTVASCRINVIDESWQAIGRLEGQLASAISAHEWHSCWFTKKIGKDRTMLLGPGCPKGDCSTCTTPKGAPVTGQQDWRRIIKHGSLRASNPSQWKQFNAYAGGKNT